jgi:hypothetical protein
VDSELIALAKTAVAEEFGLTAQQGARLRGDSADALRADARAMRLEFGLPAADDRRRDQQGRGRASASDVDMNRRIREAAGRKDVA